MKNFFERIISIDEMKTSALILVLFVTVGVAVYSVIFYKDIPSNLTDVIIALVATVGSVNAVAYFRNSSINKGQNQQIPMQNNMCGSNMSGYNSYGSNMGMMNQSMNMNQSYGSSVGMAQPTQSQAPMQTTPTTITGVINTNAPQNRGI
jgi:hypothetical protein